MMKKRGQIALFLIIGIIIIAIVAFYIYQTGLSSSSGIDVQELSGGNFNERAFNTFMSGCVEKTLTRGVYILGEQGGFLDDDAMSWKTQFGQKYVYGGQPEPKFIPSYAFWDDQAPGQDWYQDPNWEANLYTALPSLDYMEESLKVYVATNLKDCVDPDNSPDSFMNDLRNVVDIIEPATFDFSADDIGLLIRDQDVIITVNTTVEILDGPETHVIEEFQGRTQIGLKAVYEVAKWMVGRMMDAQSDVIGIGDPLNPDQIKLGYVLDSDECARFEQASGESKYLLNGQTNIYVLYGESDWGQSDYVIRFADFRPKFIKYRAPFIFQFAVLGDVMNNQDILIRSSQEGLAQIMDPNEQFADDSLIYNPARSMACIV